MTQNEFETLVNEIVEIAQAKINKAKADAPKWLEMVRGYRRTHSSYCAKLQNFTAGQKSIAYGCFHYRQTLLSIQVSAADCIAEYRKCVAIIF